MNMFLIFAGDCYYPSGGWGDYVGSYATEQDARNAITEQGIINDFNRYMIKEELYDWYHIVDLQQGKEI